MTGERLITEPGIYDLTDSEYQRDCCAEISLRSSSAWRLMEKGSTPAHVAYQEPRLNPEYEREEKRAFDIGKACHALLFGRGAKIKPIDGWNYSKNEKDGLKAGEKGALRDAAYDAGEVPLLIPEQRQVLAMSEAAKRQIGELVEAGTIEANPFGPEQSEKVIVWRDSQTGVLCRAMLDGHSLDHDALSEYKTESQGAHPDMWQWKARKLGYVFRLAFYRRGLEALKLSYSPSIRVFVQETSPPYLLALHRIEDEWIAKEDILVTQAMKIWRRCLETNVWPGFQVSGFDLGLLERERQQEIAAQPKTAHIESSEMPEEIYSGINLLVRPK